MKKIFVLFFLLLLIPLVLAEDSDDPFSFVNDPSMLDEEKFFLIKQTLVTQLLQMKNDFNANSSLPQPLKFLLNNEKINLNLGENFSIGLIFIDGKIDYLEPIELSDSDFNIYILDKFLLEFHQEKADLKQSIKTGKIRFEGVGLFNKLKITPIKLFLKIL